MAKSMEVYHSAFSCVKQRKMMLRNKKVTEKFGIFIFISYFCPRHLQVAQLVWASEPIVFGSAPVSIYGKAFIMRFVSDSLKSGQFQS